jgi:hypothetical protein|tara:strand:+ start:1070 stop:1222 length:153 start_codon:yes stop_codon:yes gene_type:complete
MIDEFVEKLARMNKQERDQFVQTLVKKWPELSESIYFLLNVNLMEKENIK